MKAGLGALLFALAYADAASYKTTCACEGALTNNLCYPSLEKAIETAQSGTSVFVGGTKTLKKPITINKNITIKGIVCSGNAATLLADMDAGEGGMLEIKGAGSVHVKLSNLNFKRKSGSGHCAGIRAGAFNPKNDKGQDLEETNHGATDTPLVNLSIDNCVFSGLSTKARGGSAIYILRAGNVVIKNSVVENNTVQKSGTRYGGGGALWIAEVPKNSHVDINADWRNNQHLFEHGLGGAIMMERVYGKVTVKGEFVKNSASDGGAIHIARSERGSTIDINGKFLSNAAKEFGWGSRGGAVRIQNVYGNVIHDGTYENNTALGGRGGCFAINQIYTGGKILIKGDYRNNVALYTGGVFDQGAGSSQYRYTYGFAPNASITVDGSCSFSKNEAQTAPSTSILSIAPLNATLSSWDHKTHVYAAQD